jgi:hypothetical protein
VNCALRCRSHNACEAEQFFGPPLVREGRCDYDATRSGPSVPEPGRMNPFIGPGAELTSFLAGEEDRAAAPRAGFQVHLAKPVDAPARVEAVAALAGGAA